MEEYLRENVPTIEDCYVGSRCSKPRDKSSPQADVVEGQMVILHSLEVDCAIWLGMVEGSIHHDPDASTESYKVYVQ